jgi:hypothetical protein
MTKRLIATLSALSLLLVSQASAVTAIKYTNQKAGASCPYSAFNKRVVLPNKHILECQTNTAYPDSIKWVDVTKKIVKAPPASLVAPDFKVSQTAGKLVISVSATEISALLSKYPTGKIIARLAGPNSYLTISAPITPTNGGSLNLSHSETSGVLPPGTWSVQLSVSLDGVQGDWSAPQSLIAVAPTPTPSPTPTSSSTETTSQINARARAVSFLTWFTFGRSELIKQLVLLGYSTQDATYAVDIQNIDWNALAVKHAKAYLALPGVTLTHTELVNQLIFDSFTQDQANFGANGLGTQAPISIPTPTVPTIQNTGGCVPLIEPQYPIASQRISILGIQWVKDAQGYVTANATMRNDNTMSLRLVEYSFYYWVLNTRKSTSYNTGTSIVPKHFVKDDPAFMGIEQTPGSWLPGQVRTFAIQTNEIVNCSILSFFATDFVVTTGVGG